MQLVREMKEQNSSGAIFFGDQREFNGVKVFSATMVQDRARLGDRITTWMKNNPKREVREIVVTQSSDEAFHCLAMTVFFWEKL